MQKRILAEMKHRRWWQTCLALALVSLSVLSGCQLLSQKPEARSNTATELVSESVERLDVTTTTDNVAIASEKQASYNGKTQYVSNTEIHERVPNWALYTMGLLSLALVGVVCLFVPSPLSRIR